MRLLALTATIVLACAISVAEGQRRMICYWNSWAHYRPGRGKSLAVNLDPAPCTHLVYNTATIDSNLKVASADPWNDLADGGGNDNYRNFNSLKNRKPSLRTLLAIGGWNTGSGPFSQLSFLASTRQEFANSAVSFARYHGFNGIVINWMFPGSRGGRPEDKKNFVELLKELKARTVGYNMLLGVDLSVASDVMKSGYDIPGISRYVDFMTLLAFDYNGYWSGKVGHVSPLYRESDGLLRSGSVHDSVREYLRGGADTAKIVLAVTTLGRTWTFNGPGSFTIGTVTSLPGYAGPYTQEAGSFGYNEVRELRYMVYEFTSCTHRQAFGTRDTFGVSVESEYSAAEKAEYALKYQLGGVAVYTLDTDDFGGYNGAKFPLTNAVSKAFQI